MLPYRIGIDLLPIISACPRYTQMAIFPNDRFINLSKLESYLIFLLVYKHFQLIAITRTNQVQVINCNIFAGRYQTLPLSSKCSILVWEVSILQLYIGIWLGVSDDVYNSSQHMYRLHWLFRDVPLKIMQFFNIVKRGAGQIHVQMINLWL